MPNTLIDATPIPRPEAVTRRVSSRAVVQIPLAFAWRTVGATTDLVAIGAVGAGDNRLGLSAGAVRGVPGALGGGPIGRTAYLVAISAVGAGRQRVGPERRSNSPRTRSARRRTSGVSRISLQSVLSGVAAASACCAGGFPGGWTHRLLRWLVWRRLVRWRRRGVAEAGLEVPLPLFARFVGRPRGQCRAGEVGRATGWRWRHLGGRGGWQIDKAASGCSTACTSRALPGFERPFRRSRCSRCEW